MSYKNDRYVEYICHRTNYCIETKIGLWKSESYWIWRIEYHQQGRLIRDFPLSVQMVFQGIV